MRRRVADTPGLVHHSQRQTPLTQALANAVVNALFGKVLRAVGPAVAARESGLAGRSGSRRPRPISSLTTGPSAGASTHGRPCATLCRCMAMAWEMGSRMEMTSLSQGNASASCAASQSASCT